MKQDFDHKIDPNQDYGQSFISAAFNDTISLENEDKTIKFPSRY